MEPQKITKLDGNDTTLSHHPYILCHCAMQLTQLCFVFVSYVQRRVVEGSVVYSAECVLHVDVHEE